jgi:hypothetical protein
MAMSRDQIFPARAAAAMNLINLKHTGAMLRGRRIRQPDAAVGAGELRSSGSCQAPLFVACLNAEGDPFAASLGEFLVARRAGDGPIVVGYRFCSNLCRSLSSTPRKNCALMQPTASTKIPCRRLQDGEAKVTVKDLVEDWIQIRAILQRQAQALERADPAANAKEGTAETEQLVESAVPRLKKCIAELNSLLKEHASSPRN